MKILIVQGTLREERRSINVARYIRQQAELRSELEVRFIDVQDLNLPVLSERRHHMDEAAIPVGLTTWKEAVDWSDGILPVVPEYNGSFPAAWKNIFDALYSEYHRKPFAICSVSSGFGGYTVVSHLRESINRVHAVVVPKFWMARNVNDAFNEKGELQNEFYEKDCKQLLDELVWYAGAIKAHKALKGDS